jgi:AAA15 family ATPase/GTPase
MISHLSIENFKSIRKLDLRCRKINIFLGEPNTGKSNILEALGVLSWCGQSNLKKDRPQLSSEYNAFLTTVTSPYSSQFSGESDLQKMQEISSYIRFEKIQNLFFKNQINLPISISIRDSRVKTVMITMVGDTCNVIHRQGKDPDEVRRQSGGEEISELDFSGRVKDGKKVPQEFKSLFFYRFVDLIQFPDPSNTPLKAPYGQNLFSVVMYDKKCMGIMKELFSSSEFKFVLKPGENKFEFQQEDDNIVYTYPYLISSDTFRHIAFYTIAIASQKNATLIFEEPESHTFPYYTKYLAEQIWLDTSNQFFIVTHNQYLLSTLIEKVSKDDIAVNIVYQKGGETQVTQLTNDQISDMICTDPFFDLESFLVREE